MIDGKCSAEQFYSWAPAALTKMLDESSALVFGGAFKTLHSDSQRNLLEGILDVLREHEAKLYEQKREHKAKLSKQKREHKAKLSKQKRQKLLAAAAATVVCIVVVVAAVVFSLQSPSAETSQGEVGGLIAGANGKLEELPSQSDASDDSQDVTNAQDIDGPVVPPVEDTMRTWTMVNGKTVQGILAGYRDGVISLEVDDQVMRVHVLEMSSADLAYLFQQASAESTDIEDADFIHLTKRIWTDVSGTQRVEAALISVHDNQLTLLTPNGSIRTVQRPKLTDADNLYLADLPQ